VSLRPLAGVAVVTSVAASAALAADPEPFDRILPKDSAVCLERHYDAKHLRAHPRQNVIHMRLYRTGEDIARDNGANPPDSYRSFTIAATFRQHPNVVFLESAFCNLDRKTGTTSCGGCGAQPITLSIDGAGRVTLKGYTRAFEIECDEVSKRGTLTGSDDAMIVLASAPAAQCNEAELKKRAPWAVWKKQKAG